MVSLTGWFKRKQPEDYEHALAALAFDIQKRQTRLSELRLRERRATLLVSLYALALWAAWAAVWYADLLPVLSGRARNSAVERAAQAVPVFGGPVVILFVRRIVQIWYTRTGDAEEKLLVALRKQQREKIEDIKRKTNYYSTRTLLERYDDAPGADSPLRRRVVPQGVPATPQRAAPPASPQTPMQAPMSPNLQQHLSPSPARPLPPPRKQWFDKLADAILGEDEGAPASRYALICGKCFAHNGLVKESMWEDAQYVCPKCGQFNASHRSQREARAVSKSRAAETVSPVQLPAVERAAAETRPASDSSQNGRPRTEKAEAEAEVDEGVSAQMEVDS
ncbi:hypothetical protein AcW1_009635 [Taiwanofungus camphoratus]|nr:hypothetical protein AcV7_002577 [Antrodia cinnamomea]KAI0948018.1 hypothetical protein AcW1_009635 [Antrodia cinnamomea]KAI0948019.1 hypothetical protein AcW1_009635 [Antrodia cinnamomea]